MYNSSIVFDYDSWITVCGWTHPDVTPGAGWGGVWAGLHGWFPLETTVHAPISRGSNLSFMGSKRSRIFIVYGFSGLECVGPSFAYVNVAHFAFLGDICARIYRPSFRENKPKTLVFSHTKRAFWACFRENWVYNFGHWSRTQRDAVASRCATNVAMHPASYLATYLAS